VRGKLSKAARLYKKVLAESATSLNALVNYACVAPEP
jgi:hypothetical protein